jgi:AcrR family transcriptional regulator
VIPVTDERPRRADAVRNREKVLVAAEEVFAEHGLKAPIEEIAKRAGVGVGTVCRHFPTKQLLLEAVLADMYASILDRARVAAVNPDAAAAFEEFFVGLGDFHKRHRAFAEQAANELDLAVVPEREELRGLVSELVKRAQDAGALRTDIGPADVSLLFSGIAHAASVAGDLQPMLRERYVSIILDGLRPNDDASPLPGRPLGYQELRKLKERRKK